METQVLSMLVTAVLLAAFCAGIAVGRWMPADGSKRAAAAAPAAVPERAKASKAAGAAVTGAADVSTMERHMINILTYDGKPQGDNRK